MSEWQPIETAPKDGTWILVFGLDSRGTEIGMSRWEWYDHERMEIIRVEYDPVTGNRVAEHSGMVGAKRGDWVRERAGRLNPSHWMPLPEPPPTPSA